MPNWCENTLRVKGTRRHLDAFEETLHGTDPTLSCKAAELSRVTPRWREYEWDSRWSPPLDWFEAIAKRFPRLTFRLRYWEPMMDLCGTARIVDGGLLDQGKNCYPSKEE